MQRTAHVAPKRVVDYLVLLHARLASKELRDDMRLVMVAVTCPYSKLRKPKKSWSFSGIQSFE